MTLGEFLSEVIALAWRWGGVVVLAAAIVLIIFFQAQSCPCGVEAP